MKATKLTFAIGLGLFAATAFANPLVVCQGDGAQLTLDLAPTDGDNIFVQYQGQSFRFAAKINQFTDQSHTRLAGLARIQADLPRRQYVSLVEGAANFSGSAGLEIPGYQTLLLSCSGLYTPPAHPHCPRCEGED